MRGNPHYEPNCTVNSFHGVEGAYHHNEAVLALVFEQRTANLIAAMAYASPKKMEMLWAEIEEGMGLK